MDEIDADKPMRELHFVCPKQDGEMITTQSLKSCNKIVQRKIHELDFFHFHNNAKEQPIKDCPSSHLFWNYLITNPFNQRIFLYIS